MVQRFFGISGKIFRRKYALSLEFLMSMRFAFHFSSWRKGFFGTSGKTIIRVVPLFIEFSV